MQSKTINPLVRRVFFILDRHFGPLNWWPGRSTLEIILGAILTQNTAWPNVEKSIARLRRNRLLTAAALRRAESENLAQTIRSSGYYNQKAEKIRRFIAFLDRQYGGSLSRMSRAPVPMLRPQLLSIKGIGPETADSILLYAFRRPVFVVDAYTFRVFGRLGLISKKAGYPEVQDFFETHLPGAERTALFNQYHACIVNLGKRYCRKRNPLCVDCPLAGLCIFNCNKL